MPSFSAIKRKNLANSIFDILEERAYNLSEWETGFLEDMHKKIVNGLDLTEKQYDKLTDIIGFDFLK